MRIITKNDSNNCMGLTNSNYNNSSSLSSSRVRTCCLWLVGGRLRQLISINWLTIDKKSITSISNSNNSSYHPKVTIAIKLSILNNKKHKNKRDKRIKRSISIRNNINTRKINTNITENRSKPKRNITEYPIVSNKCSKINRLIFIYLLRCNNNSRVK